jgi:hypothetical protein
MVYSPAGIIIGEKIGASNENVIALKNPYLLIVQPIENQPGQVNVFIAELRGKPKGMEIGNDFLNYDVTDETILDTYKRATSGLTLVKKPPLVDSNGRELQ